MKKVLSVLLAAAMVMGMSVTSMAVTFGSSSSDDLKSGTTKLSVDDVISGFDRNAILVRDGVANFVRGDFDVEPGDDLYFQLMTHDRMNWVMEDLEGFNMNAWEYVYECFKNDGLSTKAAKAKADAVIDECMEYLWNEVDAEAGETSPVIPEAEVPSWEGDIVAGAFKLLYTGVENYKGDIDKDWSINIKGDEYVTNASFYTVPTTSTNVLRKVGIPAYAKLVKVELADEFDSISETTTVSFELYIADEEFDDVESEHVVVNKLGFANAEAGREQVSFKFTNDADRYNQWEATEAGEATFDFDSDAYFTVKMVKNEAVVLNLSTAYNKDIDKAYNENEGELSFYNFKGTKDSFYRTGSLFIPADEDTFIYGVELDKDGEVEDIWAIEDAEWTDEYTIAGTSKEYEGWVIKTKELGYYVVSTEELVLPVEDAEVEAPVEAEKANPETGAADFVGAAVAMAVVSVAAAGALALKK